MLLISNGTIIDFRLLDYESHYIIGANMKLIDKQEYRVNPIEQNISLTTDI